MVLIKNIRVLFVATTALLSCSSEQEPKESFMNDQTLSEDLRLLVNKRIFFGHQSVGVDIMQGIRELCQEADSARLNVVALADTVTPSGKAFFAEGYVGKNSEPNSDGDTARRSRITSFARLLTPVLRRAIRATDRMAKNHTTPRTAIARE